MAKKAFVTTYSNRQIEILEKYFEVDKINNILTLKLHYETIDELLSLDISNDSTPLVSNDFIERIHDLLLPIPLEFKANVEITIKDYKNYDPTIFMESMCDCLELQHYAGNNLTKKAKLTAALFILLGSFLLISLNLMRNFNFIDETLRGRVFEYIIDTFACVLIWESLNLVYLYPDELVKFNKKIQTHLNSIRLFDKDDHIVVFRDYGILKTSWHDEPGVNQRGKTCLLISGTGFVILSVISLINFCTEISSLIPGNDPLSIIIFTASIVVPIFELIAGIGGISAFRGTGPFQKVVGPFAIILCVFFLLVILLFIFIFVFLGPFFSASLLVSIVFSLVFISLYFNGYFMVKKYERKKKNEKDA